MTEDEVTSHLGTLEGEDKKIVYDFLLKPFKFTHKDVISVDVRTQHLNTIPDLEIHCVFRTIKVEVKIKDADLTESEREPINRDLFLIPRGYRYENEIPSQCKKLLWEDLFSYARKKGRSLPSLYDLQRQLGIKYN